MIQQFSRIQIACEQVQQTIEDYSHLLGRAPCWQGDIVEQSAVLGQPTVQFPAAWFAVENTLLELLPLAALTGDESAPARSGLCGFSLQVTELATMADTLCGELVERSYQTASGTKVAAELSDLFVDGRLQERIFRLDTTQANGLHISLTATPLLALPQGDVEQLRVDHIVLRSNDGDACAALFADLLGLRLALDQYKPEWGGRMLFFRSGKLTLEVIAPDDGLKAGDYFWGFALKIADLEAEYQRLTDSGVALSEIRAGRKPATRVVTVKSHSGGIPVLLVGR